MSGIGHVLLQTVQALDSDKYASEFDISLFIPWDEKKSIERYSFKNIKIARLPFPHKFFSLFSRFSFGPPLDLFLGKGIYIFPNFRNWTLLHSKSLTYVHDVCFSIFPEYVDPKNRRYLNKYMPMWMRRADKVIAISESSKLEINKYLNVKEENIEVVCNAVDKSVYYRRSLAEINRIKAKYGLATYFLYLGNIEPRKNLKSLIEAFSRTNLQKKSSLFLVGGDGWLNDDVYEEIDKAKTQGYTVLKNSSYVPDEDIPALMSGAEALIQPSWHEGFGLAVIQSLACGTRVISADIPGLREAGSASGSSIRYFDPANVDDLKEAIIETAMSVKNVTDVSLSSWSQSVDHLIEIIRGTDKGLRR